MAWIWRYPLCQGQQFITFVTQLSHSYLSEDEVPEGKALSSDLLPLPQFNSLTRREKQTLTRVHLVCVPAATYFVSCKKRLDHNVEELKLRRLTVSRHSPRPPFLNVCMAKTTEVQPLTLRVWSLIAGVWSFAAKCCISPSVCLSLLGTNKLLHHKEC